jgi:hypothetical protein
MAEKKIKSSIYYTEILRNAIKKVAAEDAQGRTFNQIVIDILASDEKVASAIKELREKNS